MASATAEQDQTVADLLDRLGGIPASRMRLVPTPGTATEQDVIDVHDRTNRLCELVDGVLVEKVMGFDESRFSVLLATFLVAFLNRNDLGTIIGADGMMRLFPGLVRIPDVAFISWKRYPKKPRKRGQIPTVAPSAPPTAWLQLVNQPQTEAEVAALRGCVNRGRPFGDPNWVTETAKRLGLECRARPRGRPKKQS